MRSAALQPKMLITNSYTHFHIHNSGLILTKRTVNYDPLFTFSFLTNRDNFSWNISNTSMIKPLQRLQDGGRLAHSKQLESRTFGSNSSLCHLYINNWTKTYNISPVLIVHSKPVITGTTKQPIPVNPQPSPLVHATIDVPNLHHFCSSFDKIPSKDMVYYPLANTLSPKIVFLHPLSHLFPSEFPQRPGPFKGCTVTRHWGYKNKFHC